MNHPRTDVGEKGLYNIIEYNLNTEPILLLSGME
jgi:hypothetical protein